MSRPATTPQPGLAARFADVCPVCKGDIAPGDRVAYRRGRPVHCSCMSGQDDE